MPNETDRDRRDNVSVKEAGPGDNKNQKPKKLNHRGPAAFTEAPAIVREAPPTSPLRFYARLRHQLELRGLDYDALPRLTEPGKAPPCFSRFRVPFDAWLASASMLGATVPYRSDMPGEPNYCRDCTVKFKAFAEKRGACVFPGTKFEHVHTLAPGEDGRKVPEVEVVGASRPPRVDTDVAAAYDSWDLDQPTQGD